MNKAIIMGRFTRDPELKTLKDNLSICSGTVAVDRTWKNADGTKTTDFIPCVFFRHTAEFVSKYFTKGSRIVLVGRIQVRNYEDKDGNKRTMTEVVADEVFFGDTKGSSPDAPAYKSNATQGRTEAPDEDIRLPFDLD